MECGYEVCDVVVYTARQGRGWWEEVGGGKVRGKRDGDWVVENNVDWLDYLLRSLVLPGSRTSVVQLPILQTWCCKAVKGKGWAPPVICCALMDNRPGCGKSLPYTEGGGSRWQWGAGEVKFCRLK